MLATCVNFKHIARIEDNLKRLKIRVLARKKHTRWKPCFHYLCCKEIYLNYVSMCLKFVACN